ncbi:MAG: hypothetical protein R2744_07935 [Bacteroidales bacterium]
MAIERVEIYPIFCLVLQDQYIPVIEGIRIIAESKNLAVNGRINTLPGPGKQVNTYMDGSLLYT